ncbi:Mu transposase C-terminal domain-containing protein [Methylomonas koyamae]|uniref:Transposase-like Mu C-terminal domain-containing protein n=1 Tax=Methylomonas koyamae TaxID=702114 RepID=A0A291IFJ3_9GAMM|nr:Mu transposase C-terminal domain-containing protein [Methylomonas koyamae]ATG89104.1 hypothetical protein MKLM6_0831 [Methylomonas koyamae]OAI29800.1 hypothetical protein A1356_22875 [Methylomonas koyamae]
MTKLYQKPATLDEIAKAVGKHKATIERWANEGGWISSEGTSRGRHKKRLYALKDLPAHIREAVEHKRHDDEVRQFHEEQQAKAAVSASNQTEAETGKALTVSPAKAKALKRAGPNDNQGDTFDKQREHALAIQTVMRWLDSHPSGKQAKALRELNYRYHHGALPSHLMAALERCKQKKSGKARSNDILAKGTVEKWRVRFREQGDYVPNVKAPDLTFKPWHDDLMEMIANNPSKKTLQWMVEKLVEKYGSKVVNYRKAHYWCRTKLSKYEITKGQNSGMALKAHLAYRPRSAAGMMPWDEIHADGWATHFTAPHPRTGDYVTYEVWDFHDVATRYVPPLSIGLRECYEVIARGIENAIRDNGVMSILQTDSTKIVKNNAKFTGDDLTSLANRIGFEIKHPVMVGNAHANGIPENFHAWLDRESREIATYQGKKMDRNTHRLVGKLTKQMVKAAAVGNTGHYEMLKTEAEKISGGIVFTSPDEALAWLESKRQKWNNKPHSALKQISDPETGKMRHQTPLEALNEFKANGWEPVMIAGATLIDIFREKAKVKVRKGIVKPYANMLFHHKDLYAYEGEEVLVCYDRMDYRQVWVRNLKGQLICVAPHWEASPYRTQTAQQAADEKRGKAQIRLRENAIEDIRRKSGLDDQGNVIEGEAKRVVPFELPEPEPEKRAIEFNQVPEHLEQKLNFAETCKFLYGDQEDEEEAKSNKPASSF